MNQKIITLTLIITGFLSLILDDYLLKLIPIIRLEQLNTTFIFFGSKFGLLLIGLIILFIIQVSYKKKIQIKNILALGLGVILSYAIKYTTNIPRPNILPLIQKTSPSFPSTHATLGTILFLMVLSNKMKFKPVFYVASVLIIVSGFYNGVHYFSDIIMGVLLGIVVFGMVESDYFKKKFGFLF
jgi:membrane-associated phospholipid phosphatase